MAAGPPDNSADLSGANRPDPARSVRVLLVDDHPLILEALQDLLETHESVEVCGCARTLAETRLLLARQTPDVIVLDLLLPDSKPYETVSVVRRCCRTARIVVLTGAVDASSAEVRRCGADAYLDKLDDSDRIVETVLRAAVRPAAGELGVAPRAARAKGDPDTTTATRVDRARISRLTDREREVARLASAGHTNAEIAHLLHIAENTVKTHLAHVLRKLGLRGRVDLAARWRGR